LSQDGNDDFSKAAGFNVGKTFNDLTSVATQYLSLGVVNYKDGKVSEGVLSRAVDEGVGEITGRNAARQANNMQSDQINKAAADRQIQLQQQRDQKQESDIAASRAAGNIRAASQPSPQQNSLGLSDVSRNLSKDFLGL
jgi:hypothetical protein